MLNTNELNLLQHRLLGSAPHASARSDILSLFAHVEKLQAERDRLWHYFAEAVSQFGTLSDRIREFRPPAGQKTDRPPPPPVPLDHIAAPEPLAKRMP